MRSIPNFYIDTITLNPQHKQIVLRCDAENLFIKRIKTGFAQIHKLGHLFYRPVI